MLHFQNLWWLKHLNPLVSQLKNAQKPVYIIDLHPFFHVSAQNEFVSLAEMEDALLRNLFQGYQRWVRPIQRANDTIKVRFGLKISQLVDVVRTHTYTLPRNYSHSQSLCLCKP